MSNITILAVAYAAAILSNTVVSKAEPISDQGFVRAVAERAFGLDQTAKAAAMAFPALADALTIAALFDGPSRGGQLMTAQDVAAGHRPDTETGDDEAPPAH